ncbi:hypothetical protein T11_8879 [Trichinella zimbabwensis]|uniref:Uncharacterized protein n=1 Tax=Trichinella zimbabwensis TaxID=268475 RepID=A0A0V1H9V3_9BILA|nr:hypothetical protein T11_8879 [Trichinella zimbabwensis]
MKRSQEKELVLILEMRQESVRINCHVSEQKGLGFSGTLLSARTDIFLAKQKQGHQDRLALMEWMSLSENV